MYPVSSLYTQMTFFLPWNTLGIIALVALFQGFQGDMEYNV